MDALDAWAGSPAFVSDPFAEPSLELGSPAGWAPGPAAEGLLGEIDLAATPAAVRLARSYVRELAGEFFGAGAAVLDDLELLTSEIVTNSVVHAVPLSDGMVMLAVLHTDHHVRVEVTDGGTMPGVSPADDPLAARGRGLHLVQALAVEHGRHHNTDGTATFWFEVAVDGRPDGLWPGDTGVPRPEEPPAAERLGERWIGGWVMP
jgi:anti-sigma regulatory factor (Ser/Thr protein kinase)